MVFSLIHRHIKYYSGLYETLTHRIWFILRILLVFNRILILTFRKILQFTYMRVGSSLIVCIKHHLKSFGIFCHYVQSIWFRLCDYSAVNSVTCQWFEMLISYAGANLRDMEAEWLNHCQPTGSQGTYSFRFFDFTRIWSWWRVIGKRLKG